MKGAIGLLPAGILMGKESETFRSLLCNLPKNGTCLPGWCVQRDPLYSGVAVKKPSNNTNPNSRPQKFSKNQFDVLLVLKFWLHC